MLAPCRSGAGGRRGLNRNGLNGGVELEFAAREIFEGAFVFEENDLAERLAAGLQADAELIQRSHRQRICPARRLPAAVGCPDAQSALADSREDQRRHSCS